jgi:hypothetical protein
LGTSACVWISSGVLQDLRQRHLRPHDHGGLVARLAAEAAMRALREAVERVAHEVARHAELVVVLDVIVGAVEQHAADGEAGDCDGGEGYQDCRRQAGQAVTEAFPKRASLDLTASPP